MTITATHRWKSALSIMFVVLAALLLVYRFLQIDGLLIYRHSYGESQYALWATAYIADGIFWGIREVDSLQPIVDYFPLSSALVAVLHSLVKGNLVVMGRVVSASFSVIASIYYYRFAMLLFADRLLSSLSLFIFVSLPINMYFSKTFYNDPLHICFLVMFFFYLHCSFVGAAVRNLPLKIGAVFTLLLITKVSTAIVCIPGIACYWGETLRSGRRLGRKDLVPVLLPLVLVAMVLVSTRLAHTDAYYVESNKMITWGVIKAAPHYVVGAVRQMLDEFGWYCWLFPVGVVYSIREKGPAWYFSVMAGGFFLFYLLLIRGALVHQYYSLPLTLPFSMLATYGIIALSGLVRNALVITLLALCFVAAFIPYPRLLSSRYAPVYPDGIIEAARFLQAKPDGNGTLVLGGACRIMQYYLNLPTKNVKCDRADFINSANINAYAERNSIRYIVTQNDNVQDLDKIRRSGFSTLFISSDELYSRKFIVLEKL